MGGNIIEIKYANKDKYLNFKSIRYVSFYVNSPFKILLAFLILIEIFESIERKLCNFPIPLEFTTY